MIKFKQVKNFGRLDYLPLNEKAQAITLIRGRSLNQKHIEALQMAGFTLDISSDRIPASYPLSQE